MRRSLLRWQRPSPGMQADACCGVRVPANHIKSRCITVTPLGRGGGGGGCSAEDLGETANHSSWRKK